jgi:hypothetical protein
MNNGEIFFFHGAALQNFSQLAGGLRIFNDDDNSAGFAVETVDEVAGFEFWVLSCKLSRIEYEAGEVFSSVAFSSRSSRPSRENPRYNRARPMRLDSSPFLVGWQTRPAGLLMTSKSSSSKIMPNRFSTGGKAATARLKRGEKFEKCFGGLSFRGGGLSLRH